ncbi:MAG: M48 family metalloprotease [Erythrobacter sp.]
MSHTPSTLSRRQLLVLGSLLGGISFATPAMAQLRLRNLLDSARDLAAAEMLTAEGMRPVFDQMSAQMDRENPLAPPNDPYARRLASLTEGLDNYDGLDLDIQTYLVPDVNAFAMANGTIRIFSGLMDQFTDDEIRYVIGHEIGHVQRDHTRRRMQGALRKRAALGAAQGAGGTIGQLAGGELSQLFTQVIGAQHSQQHEREADDYALGFMRNNGYQPMAAVTALEKLGSGSSGGGVPWLQTHPSPQARARRMRAQL